MFRPQIVSHTDKDLLANGDHATVDVPDRTNRYDSGGGETTGVSGTLRDHIPRTRSPTRRESL